jgi:CheY-like chemotaxis protein
VVDPRTAFRAEVVVQTFGTFLACGRAMTRVLLIISDPRPRASIADRLRAAGLDVLATSSPIEALLMLDRAGDLDIILADGDMPGSTGFDLLKEVERSRRPTPAVLVATLEPTATDAGNRPIASPGPNLDHLVEIVVTVARSRRVWLQ